MATRKQMKKAVEDSKAMLEARLREYGYTDRDLSHIKVWDDDRMGEWLGGTQPKNSFYLVFEDSFVDMVNWSHKFQTLDPQYKTFMAEPVTSWCMGFYPEG